MVFGIYGHMKRLLGLYLAGCASQWFTANKNKICINLQTMNAFPQSTKVPFGSNVDFL